MIMSDVMIILLIIWWCVVYPCMCIELGYQIYKACYTHGWGASLWWHDWVMVDTAFYTTIVFLITESMLFIWR